MPDPTPPADPGATPPDPGATPPGPGATPPGPGATPPDPGATPPDPGATPPDPGGPTSLPGIGTVSGAENLALVQQKGWGNSDAVLDSYRALEAKISAKGIVKPGEGATPEETDAYHKALGRPDKAEDYALTIPDGRAPDEAGKAMFDAMRPAFHQAGVTQAQADVLVGAFQGDLDARNAVATKAAADNTAQLQREWGADFDAKIATARLGGKFVFGDQLDDALNLRLEGGAYLLDHPLIARALHDVRANKIDGDTGNLTPDGRQALGGGVEAAKIEYAAMKKDPEIQKILLNTRHPEYLNVRDRWTRLIELGGAGEAPSA